MSYLVLARKWRPKQFDEVVGQKPITQTLKNSILSTRIAHAYLFSGPRGVGKTTTARILAKALNCQKGPTPQPCDVCVLCEEINKGSSLDVIEIDGASNNSVDDIRDLREKVHYLPAKGRYKVYIIDEVHMLSTQAFNALLKTLEEPPEHIVFILATTEAHKIPLTILSRCQRYDFRRISTQDIRKHLDKLLSQESNIKGEKETALRLIARRADGSLRDALSLMDQIISLSDGQIVIQQILDLMSLVPRHSIEELLLAIVNGKPKEAVICIEKIADRGHNLKHFIEQMLQYVRDVIIFKLTGNSAEHSLDLSSEEADEMAGTASMTTIEDLLRYFDFLTKAVERMKLSSQSRLILETTLIKMAELPRLQSLKDIIQRLHHLEETRTMPIPSHSLSIITNETNESAQAPELIPTSQHPQVMKKIETKDKILQFSSKTQKSQNGTQENNTLQNGIQKNDIQPEPFIQAKPDEKRYVTGIKKEPAAHGTVPGVSSFSDSQDTNEKNLSGLDGINKLDTAYTENANPGGFDWSAIIQHVKGKSMAFGSVLEHLQVNYKEGSTILELALNNENPFYLQLLEDKKNKALLHAALSKVSGKEMKITWTSANKKDTNNQKDEIKPKEAQKENNKKENNKGINLDNQLDLIKREPIIELAMEIFSAEIVKTHYIKEANLNIDIENSLNDEK